MRLPHVFVILFALIVLAAVASWVIPAGQYERELGPDDRMMVVPDSFAHVEPQPAGLFDIFEAIPKGLVGAALVVFAVFIIGGAMGVVEETGVIPASVDRIARLLQGKETLMIVAIMALFAAICAFIGLLELSLFYIPVLIPIMVVMGYDTVTAAATALVSTGAGFAAALTNPFTVAIAQDIAEVELYSGMGYRSIVLVVIVATGMFYVVRYAKRVKANPESSIVFEETKDLRERILAQAQDPPEFSPRLKVAGAALMILFLVLILGIVIYRWYLIEISAMFVILAIVVGLIAGLNASKIAESFVSGLQTFVVASFAAGIARGITVILEEAVILDTVVNAFAQMVMALPAQVSSIGMFITQTILNFLIPSGSGQTLVSMPIMTPLADIAGITRQTAILALQAGDGFSNILYPTLGFLWACIGMARIPYEKWAKFIIPLILVWSVLAMIFLVIAQAIGWS